MTINTAAQAPRHPTEPAAAATSAEVIRPDSRIDLRAAERAMSDLLLALGRDPGDPHVVDTPRRVARYFREMLEPATFTLTTFPNDGEYHDMVLVRDIEFTSLCQHHLVPFRGIAHVAYLPGERVVGLSKLARVVDHFARDLQTQERLTTQIADFLQERLQADGVAVQLEAEHLCMSMRGVRSASARTTTCALRGQLDTNPTLRGEFRAAVRP
ncbi:GTP cyclohydrolase I [Tomitella biformata]|uniref:GTP cyclohydrolase I n=1 Tax=Tomitella biformata TaxID=630403 RepID=UPI0004656138|nr:GTP cyclohydrolase I [Tomitella biformata]